MDLGAVQEVLGHSGPRITSQVYDHSEAEDHRAQVEAALSFVTIEAAEALARAVSAPIHADVMQRGGAQKDEGPGAEAFACESRAWPGVQQALEALETRDGDGAARRGDGPGEAGAPAAQLDAAETRAAGLSRSAANPNRNAVDHEPGLLGGQRGSCVKAAEASDSATTLQEQDRKGGGDQTENR